MNIYEKLQNIRVDLQSNGLQKSGKNNHIRFSYFELGDFLPIINVLNNKYKLCTSVFFTKDLATLRIVNAEAPEEVIEFTSPMVSAEMKGALEIQRLGSCQTYQRRYLYMSAYEIVEHDAIDAQAPITASEKASELSKRTNDVIAIIGKCDKVELLTDIWKNHPELHGDSNVLEAIKNKKTELTK